MKIGIIGYGVVGKAIEATVSKRYSVIKYDKFTDSDSFEAIIPCDFVFISVPTPFDVHNNQVDDSAVIESLDRLHSFEFANTVIVKSTLAPGSCNRYSKKYNFEIVYCIH